MGLSFLFCFLGRSYGAVFMPLKEQLTAHQLWSLGPTLFLQGFVAWMDISVGKMSVYFILGDDGEDVMEIN